MNTGEWMIQNKIDKWILKMNHRERKNNPQCVSTIQGDFCPNMPEWWIDGSPYCNECKKRVEMKFSEKELTIEKMRG